jgi:hypothetical protein
MHFQHACHILDANPSLLEDSFPGMNPSMTVRTIFRR